MERKDRESEKLREEVKRKRAECGYKFTRQLKMSEAQEFLALGRVPADALSKATFAVAKRIGALPPGSSCMVCGADLGGAAGWIAEIATPAGNVFKTVCDADYAAVMSGGNAETADGAEVEAEAEPAPAPAPVQAPAQAAPADPVAAALQTLMAALAAPKAPPAPPVDVPAIIAEARKEAKAEAKAVMQQSVTEFIKSGVASAATGDGVDEGEESPAASAATGDGVDAAASASSWSAKATPAAKNAVEVLTKFLSEFSYFRGGVSMRLVNTFAIAADKKAALTTYCEVSQMEDLPDLIEKMKSPEFKAVCDAFAPFKPKPLNRRFAVFYGAPGGGKTYAACVAGRKINGDGKVDVVPCSPSMDAADTLYAYRLDYKSGKRGYIPTALLTAMVTGRAVVLDEVNLLPMEARMFLQNVLDNKDKVHVMGQEIPIRDGFFVLGTMNIETGLGVQPLPLPLVDRACVVREFHTTAAQAAVGAGLC